MSKEKKYYADCPMCGSPCTVEGEDGSTCYYAPLQFTCEEIDAIRRMFAERWPRPRKLSEIDQSVIDKCDAILKRGAK